MSQLAGRPQRKQCSLVFFCFFAHTKGDSSGGGEVAHDKHFCFSCVTATIAARDLLCCDSFFFFSGRRLAAHVSRGPCDVPKRAEAFLSSKRSVVGGREDSLPISHNRSAWERVCTSPASAAGRGRLEDPRVSPLALRLFHRRADGHAGVCRLGSVVGASDRLSQAAMGLKIHFAVSRQSSTVSSEVQAASDFWLINELPCAREVLLQGCCRF